jgi:hypothetical protein
MAAILSNDPTMLDPMKKAQQSPLMRRDSLPASVTYLMIAIVLAAPLVTKIVLAVTAS